MNEKKTIVSKRIVYTISTLLLCVVALFRADGNGDWWRLGINLIGICVLPILVMRLNPKSFLKIPYLVWLVIALPIACIVIKKYYYEALHRNAFAALVLEVFFYGFILIRFIIGIILALTAGAFAQDSLGEYTLLLCGALFFLPFDLFKLF